MITERKPDRRIERTRKLLQDALIALIVERGYDVITLQDITERANVARTTFYLHFKDKDDLLFTAMRERYNALIERMLQDKQSRLWESMADASEWEHVAQHADFYKVMFGSHGSPVFIVWLRQFLANVILEKALKPLIEEGHTPVIPIDILAHQMAGAEIGIMTWWLEHDMPYTPQKMAQIAADQCAFGLCWAMSVDTTTEDRATARARHMIDNQPISIKAR